MDFSSETQRLLQASVIWSYTKQGAFQRAGIYKDKVRLKGAKLDHRKQIFRKDIREYLFKNIFIKYSNKRISENELLNLIRELREYLLANYKDLVSKSSFTFGNAQKFVNLYLKGMWIFGITECPPHFPVDRMIQQELTKPLVLWTEMKEDRYKEVIAKAKAGDKRGLVPGNLAVWEATCYLKFSKDKDEE